MAEIRWLPTLLLCGCVSVSDGPASVPPYVSIIQLVANPDRYHLTVVQIEGYATLRHEGNQLCPVEKPGSTKDCVWLQYDDGPYESDADLARFDRAKARWEREFNGKRISVVGTFNRGLMGHENLWSGGIEKIRRVLDLHF
jgi:hypothetical protein